MVEQVPTVLLERADGDLPPEHALDAENGGRKALDRGQAGYPATDGGGADLIAVEARHRRP